MKNGPLSTFMVACAALQQRLHRMPYCRRLFVESSNRVLWKIQHVLDSRFDKRYGTDTSGFIPLQKLTIEGTNIREGIWYEPMSVSIFGQIMTQLKIDFKSFGFVDCGSGKGRVLLLASEFGFRKVIGVEFAHELHDAATRNIAIYERKKGSPSNIETVCMDAARFPIPEGPLVIFFYSPFKGKVMEKVLGNISRSFNSSPRQIILVFYGRNPETLELLKATTFSFEELELRPDWSRCQHYRCFLLMTLAAG